MFQLGLAEPHNSETSDERPTNITRTKQTQLYAGGLDRAVCDVIPQIQAALAKKYWPMNAPIGRKNGNADPPREPEPGGDAAFPAPQIDQMEDSTQLISQPLGKWQVAAPCESASEGPKNTTTQLGHPWSKT